MPKTALRLALAALASLVLLGASSTAQAQPERASAGLEFLYGSIKIPGPVALGGGDASLIGLNLHGHFRLGPGLLLGGHLPIVHARFNDDSGTSLGNLTAELNYRLSVEHRSYSWLDTSFSIGTADNGGNGGMTAFAFTAFWIPDPGFYAPDTNTVRIMYRHGIGDHKLRAEFQGGLHYLAINDAEDDVRLPFRIGGRIELGPQVEAMARFSTFWLLDAADNEDDFLHMLEAGINLRNVGQGSLEILVYYPLDEVYRDVFEVWGLQAAFTTDL